MDIEKLAGAKLGDYEIESLLGRGGMSVVYKARQMNLDRPIALKILPSTLGSDASLVKRFKREARAVAKLDHSNIVQIFDIAEEEGFHFFSMQYVDGKTLDMVIKENGRLKPNEAVRIISQAGNALEHAHKNKIVHRDIKPSNIILDKFGGVKVMDFGLARALENRSEVTQFGAVIGTLQYMSPEQCRGQKLDFRTDIYSLGVVLYETLTGKNPFIADSVPGFIHKIVYEEHSEVREFNPDIPAELSIAVSRAMAKKKEDRYASVSEFLGDIACFGDPESGEQVSGTKFGGTKRMTIPPAIEDAVELIDDPETAKSGASVANGSSSPSIAVLPFVNMSADPEQEYFCDGLAEELISALTHIENLKVIARTSAFSFKGRNLNIRDIGRELDVRMILEGSVRKAGNRLRITAQLVDTEKGHHMWSERYDRPMDDIFAIQDEITQVIVDILKPKLVGEEKETPAKHQKVDLGAYSLYLKGRWYWDKQTEQGILKAIELFESAIKKDPGYAPAYAGLADSYCTIPLISSFPPKQCYPKAKKAALRAFEIDETLAEAHASLAHIILHYDWDWEAAEDEYRISLELNPGCASSRFYYSIYLRYMGRYDESLREMMRALELDPLSLLINANTGLALCYSNRLDEAIEVGRRTLDMDPSHPYSHFIMGYIYLRGLMFEEAVAGFEKSRKLSEHRTPVVECVTGVAYALKGMTDKARSILDSLIGRAQKEYFPPYLIAAVHFALGDVDEGFSRLEEGYEERDYFMINLRTERTFIALGLDSDPRYIELIRKMNFPI